MTRTKKKTLAVLMALSVVIPGSIAPTSEAAAKKVKLSKKQDKSQHTSWQNEKDYNQKRKKRCQSNMEDIK